MSLKSVLSVQRYWRWIQTYNNSFLNVIIFAREYEMRKKVCRFCRQNSPASSLYIKRIVNQMLMLVYVLEFDVKRRVIVPPLLLQSTSHIPSCMHVYSKYKTHVFSHVIDHAKVCFCCHVLNGCEFSTALICIWD